MTNPHCRHASYPLPTPSHHPSPAEASGSLSSLEAGGVDDAKLHAAHAHSLRSHLVDPLLLASRQIRLSTVPFPVLAIGCLLAFLAGSWVHTAEMLPAPGGPTVGGRCSGMRLRVLQEEKRFFFKISNFRRAPPSRS